MTEQTKPVTAQEALEALVILEDSRYNHSLLATTTLRQYIEQNKQSDTYVREIAMNVADAVAIEAAIICDYSLFNTNQLSDIVNSVIEG